VNATDSIVETSGYENGARVLVLYAATIVETFHRASFVVVGYGRLPFEALVLQSFKAAHQYFPMSSFS
jgi:hypothetical protein